MNSQVAEKTNNKIVVKNRDKLNLKLCMKEAKGDTPKVCPPSIEQKSGEEPLASTA